MADGRQWTRNKIEENLRKHDKWVVKAIIAIHSLQTSSERRCKSTHKHNNVGFNSADARFLSSLAESAKKSMNKYNQKAANALTDKQLEAGRDAIMKYSKQLKMIANGNIENLRS
jgi:hypothetical protein